MQPSPAPYDMVRAGLCIGCGSCVAQSPGTRARMGFDADGLLVPHGPRAWRRAPPRSFVATCPFSAGALDEDALAVALFADAPRHASSVGRYRAAYVGHVAERGFRRRGSSGGMAGWVAAELLRTGRVDGVAHVVPADPLRGGRRFRYAIARDLRALRAGARSRYYPVELSEVLEEIRTTPGRYAVIGIPCFVKAVQLLRRADPLFGERIRYTLGLFCGHMKSARFADSIALQLGADPAEVRRVEFRDKTPDRPANWYHARLELRDGGRAEGDWWHLADGDWGAGYFMAGACNWCDDVVAETADVSFGDAWVEPHASDWRGTNVVVVRSREIQTLIDDANAAGRLALTPVDADYVARTQAAGLRQRREGLAWRLARLPHPTLRKRVRADVGGLTLRRRLIYAMRWRISAWSHRVWRLAGVLHAPWLYVRWARVAAALYHALAYHRGRLGALAKRCGLR